MADLSSYIYIAANTVTAANVSATGNVVANNAVVTTGNVTGGNITTAGQVSATGNITTANYFVGNLVGTTVSTTGNISAGNVIINGQSTTYGVVTPAYMVVGLLTSVSGFSNGSTFILDTVVGNTNSQVSYNSSTGVFTLTAGVTYDMSFTPSFIGFSNTTTGFFCYDWVDATTNAQLDSTGIGTGTSISSQDTTAQQDNATARVIYTPNTNQTVKLRVTNASGTVTLRGGIGTQAVIKPLNPTIAVQATATGTLNTDYISVTNATGTSANYGATGASRDVILDTNLTSQGIAYNASTGVYTLTAGKTYRITSTIGWYNTTPGYINFNWVDSSTNTAINSITITQANNSWATDQIDPLTADFIYTPVTNQSIKMRVYGSSNNTFSIMGGGTSKVVIQQIANTFALNAIDTMSVTGNVSANNFVGNGNTLSNVATKTSGSWTLASGVNTVSINVPVNGTYSIWVNGNIPNGIITYTATAVVTNTNVPVLGEQYGWYYAVGNALVLTSIPNQFTGTVGSISTVNTYAGNTANVFTFGITNNSGSTAVVNYGYTKL
jgi:hypothetical protein